MQKRREPNVPSFFVYISRTNEYLYKLSEGTIQCQLLSQFEGRELCQQLDTG